MTEKIRYCCPCHFGLESVLAFEIKKIGGENLLVSDGRISFDGDIKMLAKANICLASAERVLIELGTFEARSFEELFQGVKALEAERYIGKKDAFPVKGHSLKSALHSIPDCQSIIKKALVERLKPVYGVNRFEESGAVVQVRFNILKDVVSIYLDTSGQGLHKRGYRRTSNDVPIKETLAAGIIDLANVRGDSVVCDPMCGSGTLIIEAAYKALRIAPGLKRSFAAQSWESIPSEIWDETRLDAREQIAKDNTFTGYASDIDSFAVDLTQKNVKYAGVANRITVSKKDISEYKPKAGVITVCNPPYGERMFELRQAQELYKKMGQVLCPSKSNPCYIICADEEFEKFFGKKADKKRKLYNGMLKCQLYMYYM